MRLESCKHPNFNMYFNQGTFKIQLKEDKIVWVAAIGVKSYFLPIFIAPPQPPFFPPKDPKGLIS